MKKLFSLLTALCLCLCLTAAFTHTAYAGDLDYIHRYDVTVTPNVEDGSLRIRVDFQWEVLDEGPVEWLEIGIPNGSIREVEALTDNIASLSFDNSFMYVTFDRGYDDGELINFSYAWTQEYMYTLGEDFSVTYDYTPGWFDGARIGEMTVTWNTPAELPPAGFSVTSEGDWEGFSGDGATRYTKKDLSHGEQIRVGVRYSSWPTQLFWENSAENLPGDEFYYPDYDYGDDYYDDGDDLFAFLVFLILVIGIILVISAAASSSGYAGGFGTHYVHVHGLWYPAGRDGRPRPGSVGTKHKPQPPRSSGGSRGGGFGGGSRGGGFGGGGFGGGSHCACASSCACACACACAGGGRAGCSAKNLYGAVRLDRELSENLLKK